ncbi:MAG: hypothetical protein ACIAQF_09195 [Phycisphaerales bacterium JB065]
MARTPGYQIAEAVKNHLNDLELTWPGADESCVRLRFERKHHLDWKVMDLERGPRAAVIDRESDTSMESRSHNRVVTMVDVVVGRKIASKGEKHIEEGDEVKQFAADIADRLDRLDLSSGTPAIPRLKFKNATIGVHASPERLREHSVLLSLVSLEFLEII